MAKKIQQFEDMAREMVGDGKSPNLYFISTYDPKTGGDGAIVGVVRSLEIAKGVGGHYDAAVVIEDRKTGVVWENAASERFQRAAMEAEEAEYASNPGPSRKLKNKLLR